MLQPTSRVKANIEKDAKEEGPSQTKGYPEHRILVHPDVCVSAVMVYKCIQWRRQYHREEDVRPQTGAAKRRTQRQGMAWHRTGYRTLEATLDRAGFDSGLHVAVRLPARVLGAWRYRHC